MLKFLVTFFCIFTINIGFGSNEKVINGLIHEAFMNVEAPITLLIAVEKEPPSPLEEIIPYQYDDQATWIPGYWEWLEDLNRFVWCSGNFRRAPIDLHWIPGYWTHLDMGWVRVRGFWSKTLESELVFIPTPPPDQYNENSPHRPEKSFWMSGYWQFENGTYVWYTGQWKEFDHNWIYVPSKYVWRPEGYVFVSAFWDWPIDQRGSAYPCLIVPKSQSSIDYVPEMILKPSELIDNCLFSYPDYYYFYDYTNFFHPDWVADCIFCPPWWIWHWGMLSWSNQWALWWWWTHPGFPAPIWLDPAMIDLFFPPPIALIEAMKKVTGPLIITEKGVITPRALIDATKNQIPVFPQNPRKSQNELAKSPQAKVARPNGERPLLGNVKPPLITPAAPFGASVAQQPSIPNVPLAIKPTKPKEQNGETLLPSASPLPKSEYSSESKKSFPLNEIPNETRKKDTLPTSPQSQDYQTRLPNRLSNQKQFGDQRIPNIPQNQGLDKKKQSEPMSSTTRLNLSQSGQDAFKQPNPLPTEQNTITPTADKFRKQSPPRQKKPLHTPVPKREKKQQFMKPPSIELPRTKGPKKERSDLVQPQIKPPQIKPPQIKRPQIEFQKQKKPEIKAPELKRPKIEIPKQTIPQINRPKQKPPKEIKAPEIKAPEIKVPQKKEMPKQSIKPPPNQQPS